MKIDVPTSLTIDNVEHDIAEFSDTVKRLVAIHTEWRNDLANERLAVAKTEAAIRGVDAELAQLVASELKAKQEPEVVGSVAVEVPQEPTPDTPE